MKRVIALRYDDSRCDMMLNIAIYYGLRYTEYENQMLFFIREEIADERTAYFFGDLLCRIFGTAYSNQQYDYPEEQPDYEVGIYNILFAFIDCVRKSTDEKHYKEQLRKIFSQMKIDLNENLPAIHLLKDNTYTLTPTESYCSGYDVKYRIAKWKLSGNTQKEQSVRRNKRAVYRNFRWENLYENCALYRDFVKGNIETTEQIYLLARNLCGAERGKQKFMEIMNSEKNSDKYYRFIHWKEILTALGKTSTYIQYMLESQKSVLIAVPTHELKEQIIRDAKIAGVEEICGTPDMNSYGISAEIINSFPKN